MSKRNDSNKTIENSKTAAGATKRRALGDITNAVRQEEVRNIITKKNVSAPTASHEVMVPPEVSSMNEVLENMISMGEDRLYMQRPSDNIDARDEGNILLVTEYVDTMYEHFRELEAKFAISPVYMQTQLYVNDKMRTILIDWLVEVHMKFKMVPETLYATVNYIDRYLEKKEVRRSRLQLVGVACLLLASKYEEIYPPELKELVYITDRAYNKEEIIQMETEIICTLDYQCTIPTAHTFLCRYLKAAHADRTMVQLACYLAERSLQEMSVVRFIPSTIAATAILIARKTLKRHPWSPTLLKYTGLDEAGMADCVLDMKGYLENSTASQQHAVYRKYSGPKFGSVAALELVF